MPNILDDIIASVVENKIPASRQSITTKLLIKQEPVAPGNNNNSTSTTPPAVTEDSKPDRKKSVPVTAAVSEESTNQYPDIPHCWLNGKQLLWLKDHRNQNNWKLFRECWKQGQVHGCCHSNGSVWNVVSRCITDNNSHMNGFVFVQPVLVSGIHKRLNASLWKADSFNQEFADHQGDLLNCKDQVVSNSGIKEFWDGFEDITSECIFTWPNQSCHW